MPNLAETDLAETEVITEEVVVVPLVSEELRVGKATVETGQVRLVKTVTEREEVVDEPLLREDVEVLRIPVGLMVDAAPAVRYEGDMMIVPVLEEVLVVEKRLRLKEELHITRRQTQTHAPQSVTLRSEEVAVERISGEETL